MSRGGRRRKGKRGRKGSGAPEPVSGQQPAEEREPQPAGRRRGYGRKAGNVPRESSVLQQMRSLPTMLQTLPPDGTDLEELIGAMQSEYGVPATPQEYRLIIKTPAPEEPTDPTLEVGPADPSPEPGGSVAVRQRTGRRRRRGRRRAGAPVAADADLDPDPAMPEFDQDGHESYGEAEASSAQDDEQ